MKTLTLAGALLVLTCGLAAAQNDPSPGALEKPTAAPQQDNSGTNPENKASTGWTGASRVASEPVGKAPSPGNPSNGTPSDGPLGPEMATGLDLKGPPMSFPNNKTPE